MSIASVVGQVVYKRKSSVYMPALMSDKGDLYQEYDGTSDNPTDIAPDFAVLQPTLSYVIVSSRVAEGNVVPKSVKWYFNDTLLTFSGNVSTNTLGGETGHFQQIPYSKGVQEYFALKIKKNLVKAAGAAPCTIKAEAVVKVGNTEDEIQFVYSIPITYGVGNSKRVTIMAGDTKNFTIRQKGENVKLKAVARVGADEITSGLTYAWFKLVGGSWNAMGVSSQTLTVNEIDISGASQYKVEVSQNGMLIGMDVQTVIDATEPYDIIVGAVPADETISDPGDTVVYTPKLVKRGTTQAVKSMRFYFTFMGASGIILNPGSSNTPSTTGTCTYGMCDQEGGNVSYVIMTEE